MIRSDFFQIVGRRYNLDFTTTAGNDYSDMTRSYQEAIYEVLKRIPFSKTQVAAFTPGAVAGLSVLSQDWLYILEIKRNGDGLPLEKVGKRDIDYLQRSNVVSTPAGSGVTHFAFDKNWLHFWPTPAASDTFTLDVIPQPTASGSSDDPETAAFGGIPLEHQGLILEWMLMRAAEYQGNWQQGEYHSKRFEAKVVDAKGQHNMKGGRQARVPVVGYPAGRARPGRRNDVYP